MSIYARAHARARVTVANAPMTFDVSVSRERNLQLTVPPTQRPWTEVECIPGHTRFCGARVGQTVIANG